MSCTEEPFKECKWCVIPPKERDCITCKEMKEEMKINEALAEAKRKLELHKTIEKSEPSVIEYDELVVKALEKAEKYKWHDLRENPKDLPSDDNNSEVMYITKGGSYYFSDTYTLRLYLEYAKKEYEDVIAWKYIEPFEEVGK